MIKLIRDMTSAYEDVLTIHGEGSLAAQRLSIYALADFERYEAAANEPQGLRIGPTIQFMVNYQNFRFKSNGVQ